MERQKKSFAFILHSSVPNSHISFSKSISQCIFPDNPIVDEASLEDPDEGCDEDEKEATDYDDPDARPTKKRKVIPTVSNDFMDYIKEDANGKSRWKETFQRSLADVREETKRFLIETIFDKRVYDLYNDRHHLCLGGVSFSYPGTMHPVPLGLQPNAGWLRKDIVPSLDFPDKRKREQEDLSYKARSWFTKVGIIPTVDNPEREVVRLFYFFINPSYLYVLSRKQL